MEAAQPLGIGNLFILDRLLSPRVTPAGLGDQGSDTQDSTWILVQHFVTSTTTQNYLRGLVHFQCLPTLPTPSSVCRDPACAQQILMPTRRRDRSLKEPHRHDFQRMPLSAISVF
jgi:hypothetical protein